MAQSIALFGCGRMGSALATGWLKSDPRPTIRIQDPTPSDLVTEWSDAGLVSLNGAPAPADTLIVAVKPQVFPSVLDQIKPFIGPQTLVLSIMAGFTIEKIQAALGTERVARAMPNTPGAVGEGVTLIAVSDILGDDDVSTLQALLQPLGSVEGPMSERDLQIAMTVSGCGPAYVFHLVEAMAKAGIAKGLDPDLSMRIARQTVIGGGALLAGSEASAENLRIAVTSPGGVTAAALEILMGQDGFSDLMTRAVTNALKRDEELSS